VIQKAFLQIFKSYELLSVIKLLFFLLREIFYSKAAKISIDIALCLLIANATSCIILVKYCLM